MYNVVRVLPEVLSKVHSYESYESTSVLPYNVLPEVLSYFTIPYEGMYSIFEGTVQLFNASTVHVQLVSPLRNSKKTSKKTYVYVYTCTGTRDKKQKKTRTKGYARAPSRETYLLPRMRSRRISLCTIAFQASTPNFLRRGFCVHALCRERGTRTSRIAISGKIYDFFVTRSIVRMPSNCHRAKFRAQTCITRGGDRFRARVLTRTLLYVFFCHEYVYTYT